MPQISKIRIVNFYYNNGHTMIPDELFDISGNEEKQGLNTLISLENGGGKSVLVQLMMQPIIPCARGSSDRKIENYFKKSSDHCFVVIEWKKDASDEKLLTGIAIAGSSDDDTNERGKEIRYYTFLSEYLDYSGRYDIINLPLSENIKGRFVPAGYDAVQKLAKASTGRLRYYSKSDKSAWKRKLSEYGILPELWKRLTEQINMSEDGMKSFFDKFKTSDQLIDNLLIKTTESSSNRNPGGKVNGLEDMLNGYLNQYINQAEQMRERDVCKKFSEDMKNQKNVVKELWKDFDAYKQKVGEMFAFSEALNLAAQRIQTQIDELNAKKEQIDSQIAHIKKERASNDYYHALEAFQEAEKVYETAKKDHDDCKEKKRRMQTFAEYL